ncbi:CGNR zinc finger domain-containing protein [Pseudonocardia spinosispora]|uniref:CGNR zinc finger domain-containing protein n=1 Tax=Pseudonocardia spinosispora TaxID=103441 RepID=UPI0003FA4F2A|nr:CGNR zinc finger domain-containing protein [Pseudonocardia spinosispora]
MTPEALVALANLGRPRRPAGTSVARGEPILPDLAGASGQLAGLLDRPVTEPDLAGLRGVHHAAARAAEAILAGEPVDCAELNALAADSTARIELVVTDGTPSQRLTWDDATPASALARRLITELSALDPARLRRCAREQCDLLFYDTTRSRTRRWHAEDPCGWRERQHTHRTRR